mmetsp:Transcript_6044/g.14543  ORF Transcript_6044/g.14543 Transcript_6044/m.14543 type:complete len:294 (-) Transcript_6044:255-1136(-)|eukprot:CAMPEP_0173435044 /NCGR_PEP_ID=MMETSP1357-20121228/14055_1 /TAXON_ID=77926 /ORGANISM="Hemiselmis rufescens, Strain PCC563" /LENGTH=293 /DNA_ID=CAMNT_0014399979 /DNA_START=8 /DNA_END=889 /DNA_ORIENTATION=+
MWSRVALAGALSLSTASAFSVGSAPGLAIASKPLSATRSPQRTFALRSLKAQEQTTYDDSISTAAKERLYLDCCAAFNVEKKSLVTDDDFEQLKSDLAFEGSEVIMFSREEIKFMVATQRYKEGKPIMDDAEYDTLRQSLKALNSPAALFDTPACKIRDDGNTVCKSDLSADDGKNALLYTPALVLVALLFNEFTFWSYGWDPLLSLIAGSPLIAAFTYVLTNYVYFQSPYITKAQCPKCTTPQNIYFGDVLFVNKGFGINKAPSQFTTQCVNKACGADLKADKDRMLVVAEN